MTDPIRETAERLLQRLELPSYTPYAGQFLQLAISDLRKALAANPPAPAPAGHVPDAGNMVAADGEREEREELARWLEFEADNAQELGCATIYDHDRLRWVAGYLRQLAPAPAPAADGEHEELAQWLDWLLPAFHREHDSTHASNCLRAAALLREARPQPPQGGEVEA